MRATHEGLAREALHPIAPDERALLAFPGFASFRRHGVPRGEAGSIVRERILRWLGVRPEVAGPEAARSSASERPGTSPTGTRERRKRP